MSKPFDSPNNESAYSYAFALAMSAHLAQVESKFLSLPAEDFQSLEQTLWAQDMSTNLHLVREYGLNRLVEYYRKEDLLLNCPQGQYKHALSYSMEYQLLGARVKSYHNVSTEQILDKVDELAPFTGVLLYTNQLKRKLYLILTNATKVSCGAEGDSLVVLAMSNVLADYLAHMATEMSSQLDISALSMQIESTVAYLRQEANSSCDYATVFKMFKALLASQLEVASARVDEQVTTEDLVLRLRESGNNLMTISSYPQAVKVYTEAIDMCDWTCSNNIPQLYTNRAIAFIGLNCFTEAVSDLNSALSYDRSFTPAWAQLGYCHLYLGSGLLALRCYLTALRTVAGEIYPENFPENQDMRAEYTNNKVLTIVPQFVQRLVQSIMLSEKRATQQRQSSLAIQELTTRTRAILARLRATVPPEDVSYLSYSFENAVETVRATAARANRTRPSILTPEVAQDIMASTNVEASAMTILPPIVVSTNNANVNNNNTNTQENTNATRNTAENTQTTGVNVNREPRVNGTEDPAVNPPTVTFNFSENAPEGLRNMLNNLGDAFGEMVQTQLVPPNQQTAGNTEATQAPTAGVETQAGSNNVTALPHVIAITNPAQAGNTQTAADFRNSFNHFIPDIRGNLGGIISQALSNHHQVLRNNQNMMMRTHPNPNQPAPDAREAPHIPGAFPTTRTQTRRVVRLGTPSVTQNPPQGTNPNPANQAPPATERQSTERTPENSTPSSEPPIDTDMPDAPDLD